MKITVENLKELAKSVEKNNISEFILETEEAKVILKRGSSEVVKTVVPQKVEYVEEVTNYDLETEEILDQDNENYDEIISPMVGTFYKAPSPGAAPFVKEGDIVKEGDTLCIVEAMKLMNEVKSNISGKIVKILIEDGQAVKKGDKLFLIEAK
ncbi:acetyl-CoA carboxylase biotin carboxyl carrier protein [Hypnocyclicus thermotrophus]|uniref:Biotin carboxyl carrier protein of acetyl-CoA carboxylase n=1 Tax=Hypnocyclicus thermotrophus TaxID=1627895 RepID=A0AA46DXF2_9FUSO|nr:acetyl-CoA carboxylase biotin carboxyl carrier protein [Hypnocyclicus thermotrophus]TDT68068.1 acetyl-CoA carboxylase biotin carboxyl carrier protein [Hypnocyclicus thermotrophus]